MAILVASFCVATVRYAQTSFAGAYGRFIFPALPAIGIFVAFGWLKVAGWLKVPRLAATTVIAITCCTFATWALLDVLRPAYELPTKPAPVDASGLDLGRTPG